VPAFLFLQTEVEAVTTEAEENVKEVEIRQCFTLKKLIASLHIVQPAYHVMCLLGKKWVCDASASF